MIPTLLQERLASDDERIVAHALTDVLFDQVRKDSNLGGEEVASRLEKLRSQVWVHPQRSDTAFDPAQLDDQFRQIISGIDGKQKQQLLEAYARMGHLYDIAALQARANHFHDVEREGHVIPGSVEECLKGLDYQATLAALEKPVFEVIMTMHPTNVNSLLSMQLQRALGMTVEAIAHGKGQPQELEAAVHDFAASPITHTVNGKDAKLSVRDETSMVLYSMGNIYEDLPRSYRQYDKTLTAKAKSAGTAYNPLDLKLNFRLGSWGSAGDKDGNKSVTSETTLEAVALHKSGIMDRYAATLTHINHPSLDGWKKEITQWQTQLHELLKEVADLRDVSQRAMALHRKRDEAVFALSQKPDDAELQMAAHEADMKVNSNENPLHDSQARQAHEQKFDDLSKRLSAIQPSAQEFEQAVTSAYREEPEGARKQELLNLVRRVRMFGFDFSKIEYRETAEEYTRVVDAIIPREVISSMGYGERNYASLRSVEQVELLNNLLMTDNPELQPAALLAKVREKITEGGVGVPYTDEGNAMPISYHTIKRLELARDHGRMIQDNVLAECKDPSNVLEAQFLQHACKTLDGKKPLLGVIPLFEEKETITEINSIMKRAYNQQAYRNHLKELAADRHGGKIVQQVQIAHSDNARRAGLPAARAFIHEAHEQFRLLNKQTLIDGQPVQTQFFEGGSISDAYRNGVRAVSAAVNAFGLHDFAKFTFQGGDLLNFFNQPSSIERIFARNIPHQAAVLSGADHTPKYDTNGLINRIAIEALKRTYGEYNDHDFVDNAMGRLLNELNAREKGAGSQGSRAGARGPAIASSTVKIGKMRTIEFSEMQQQWGIVPSFIGAMNVNQYLVDEIKAVLNNERDYIHQYQGLDAVKNTFGNLAGESSEVKLTPQQVRTLYQKAPVFRDVYDRIGFAGALSDIDAPRRYLPATQNVDYYQKRLPDSYVAAGAMAMAALRPQDDSTGALPNAGTVSDILAKGTPVQWEPQGFSERVGTARIQQGLQQMLNGLQPTLRDKRGYRQFLLFAKGNEGFISPDADEVSSHLRVVGHSAGDTVFHGRWLKADDPPYGRSVTKHSMEREGAALIGLA